MHARPLTCACVLIAISATAMSDPITFASHRWTRKERSIGGQYRCCAVNCETACSEESARCPLYTGNTEARVCVLHAIRLSAGHLDSPGCATTADLEAAIIDVPYPAASAAAVAAAAARREHDAAAVARQAKGIPTLAEVEWDPANLTSDGAEEMAATYGFCALVMGMDKAANREYIESLQGAKPETEWRFEQAGARMIISGNVIQYDLALCRGARAQSLHATTQQLGSQIASVIKDRYALDFEVEMTAGKLLCAPPAAPRQIFHADTARGFAEKARIFSVLLAITDGHESTLLSRFRLEDLPSPVDVSQRVTVESPQQRAMLKSLEPLYFSPASYKSVPQAMGHGFIIDQRVFHAGPANRTRRERRRLFMQFERKGAPRQSDYEQQLYEWVYAEWAHGANSIKVAEAIVRNKLEDVLGRINPAMPWRAYYIRRLKKHGLMEAYMDGNPTITAEMRQLINDTPALA